jgi:ribA/ribD-fused uncharacterized protein
MESNNTINFNSHRNIETGYLSNFYNSEFSIDNKVYRTTEHYFQAAKFFETNPDIAEKIRLTKDPMYAKKIAKDNYLFKQSNWEEVRYDIMKQCLIEKFNQNVVIKKKLLSTGDAILVEHTQKDDVWGDGGDGSGLNLLGKCLMEVREILQNDNK